MNYSINAKIKIMKIIKKFFYPAINMFWLVIFISALVNSDITFLEYTKHMIAVIPILGLFFCILYFTLLIVKGIKSK